MIILNPSPAIAKETKLDFNLISFILSQFVKTKRKVNISIQKSKTNYSAFYVGLDIIKLNLKENNTTKYYIQTLLHEIRHYLQVKNVKKKLLFEYDNYIDYYCSPEEKDARNFEKLATDVCKIYNCYKNINLKIKELKLDSFKELQYNYEEQQIKATNK